MRQTAERKGHMKILYVEDNDDNVYMLKNRLTRAGFTVLVASDGARGIAMAASGRRPDAGRTASAGRHPEPYT